MNKGNKQKSEKSVKFGEEPEIIPEEEEDAFV